MLAGLAGALRFDSRWLLNLSRELLPAPEDEFPAAALWAALGGVDELVHQQRLPLSIPCPPFYRRPALTARFR